MNLLDLILLVPLIWGAYRGFRKGLIFELTTFIALFAGIYGAMHFSGIAEPYLKTTLGSEQNHIPLIAFGLTFLAILIGVHLLGRLLHGLVQMVALGLLNGLLGGIFGILKFGVLLLALLIMIRSYSPEKGAILPKDLQEGSFLLTNMDRITEGVMRYELGEDPSSVREAIEG